MGCVCVAREGRPRSPVSLFFSPTTVSPHPPPKLSPCLTVSTHPLMSVSALDVPGSSHTPPHTPSGASPPWTCLAAPTLPHTPPLRSVPALDGATVTFNGTGDIIYAIQRRPGDGELSLAYLHQRSRTRHPLHTAFR